MKNIRITDLLIARSEQLSKRIRASIAIYPDGVGHEIPWDDIDKANEENDELYSYQNKKYQL